MAFKKRRCLFLLFFLFLLSGNYSKIEAANPQGRIYGIDDYIITGSAWDPDCSGTPVEVHVYVDNEPQGVVCHAAYDCPWGEFCFSPKTGFWCAYRHPVNASSVPTNINIAVINKCGSGENIWLDKSQAVTVRAVHDREKNTILVDKPAYKIGISKRFGASVVEFYNKRVDQTLNLVQSDPGAALQVAIFGDPWHLVGSSPNCFGNPPEKKCNEFEKKVEAYFAGGVCGYPNNVEFFRYDWGWGFAHPYCDLRYNPTQAGSHCGHPNGSEIRHCWADGVKINCANLPANFTGKQLKFDVHFKNFFYPFSADNNYSYRDFDDVYGIITYNFENDYVQIDYDIWKARDTKYGAAWSSLPVAFLLQLSKAVYKKDGQICVGYNCKSVDNINSYEPTWGDNICINNRADGRWVTVLGSSEGVNSLGVRKTATPSDFLTLAFYNQPIKGSCSPRNIQVNFLPNGGGVQNGIAVQNGLYFEAELYHNMKFRSLIFPYKNDEILPGKNKNLGELVDSYAFAGGFMPEWECNMADFNNDGKTDGQDVKALLQDYKSNKLAADLSADGLVNGLDFGFIIKLY
ncbi:MAG TPA: hypothetical protein DCK87_03830 [Desulfotomaculum sp.]|nr:hypothetical protein [Desulfotomaculum sp.]